ncbi:MAG TPA: dicarboxylate/amino acid:cation symporter [Methylomirabilota bacterium]|nr:dicarboxylate/amino acid:cation symporter [Methylomirabilota bacterium]
MNFIRRVGLTRWIIISMVVGIFIGVLFPEGSQDLRVISNVFLRLIKCLLVPLIFSTLVVGIAGHGDDLKSVGRLALKSIIYFEIVTTLALVIGLAAVNVMEPGKGVQLPAPDPNVDKPVAQKVTFSGIIEHLAPQSFFAAAAANDVLQVVVFAILFGVSMTQARGPGKKVVLRFFEGVTEIMFKFVGIVMLFAPFGIGAAMAYTVGDSGLGILVNLGKLVLTLYIGLIVFCVVVLWPAAIWARMPVGTFLKALRAPIVLAFSTTSSDAAMPQAIEKMQELGVPKRIVSFVMPLGYSFNLDGSTLHLAVASIFVSQAAGVDLSLGQQLAIMLTLMLTSKGMAGVPRASQVVLAGTLASFGLPLEGVVIIMGVDELMDMARTTVNLVGNCLATAVVGRWEGEFPPVRGDAAEASMEPKI